MAWATWRRSPSAHHDPQDLSDPHHQPGLSAVSVSNKTANSFVTLDNRIENASSDLGASGCRPWQKLSSPYQADFYTSFISIFTSSMTSMGAIAFIVSPGMNLASMELFGAVENGKYGVASVMAVLMIGIIALVNVIAILLKNRKRAE